MLIKRCFYPGATIQTYCPDCNETDVIEDEVLNTPEAYKNIHEKCSFLQTSKTKRVNEVLTTKE